MSRYLNSPREADWYACPWCGDEVRVGSSGCQRCSAGKGRTAEAAQEENPAETEGFSGDTEEDFNYDEWKKREFGTAARIKPHHLPWKYWVAGIVLIVALLWAAVFAGFMSH